MPPMKRIIESGIGQHTQPEEAAQDVVFRWLKQHIASLPRHEGIFLTEAEVAKATGRSSRLLKKALAAGS